MTTNQINEITLEGEFREEAVKMELVETHISWVFVCERFVFKIKKPVKYSFLDFSSLERRKFFCEREIELNRRFTDDIYLDVQSVKESNGRYSIGGEAGEI